MDSPTPAPQDSWSRQSPPPDGALRSERLAWLTPLLERQQGLAARRQLHACGWTEGQIEHEIRYGRWHAPARGVVATHNSTLHARQRPWLGLLYAGPGAVLSHLTAARWAGLRWVGDETIDVLTAKGDLVPPLDGFCFHQTRRPYERWVHAEDGPPRVPVEHALLLTAERDRSIRRAIGLLAAGVQQGLTSPEALCFTIPQLRKLRHGKVFALALGDIAGGADSFAEIDLGKVCERTGLTAPVRQVMRRDKEGRRRFLDATWKRADGQLVVLEIDGGFHREVDHWWKDMRRERSVVLDGQIVLRCSSIELRLHPADLVEDLRRAGVPPATPIRLLA